MLPRIARDQLRPGKYKFERTQAQAFYPAIFENVAQSVCKGLYGKMRKPAKGQLWVTTPVEWGNRRPKKIPQMCGLKTRVKEAPQMNGGKAEADGRKCRRPRTNPDMIGARHQMTKVMGGKVRGTISQENGLPAGLRNAGLTTVT